MEREPGSAEQVATAEQIDPVVDVAAVGRASACVDDADPSEFAQVVGDEVLGLFDELHELSDPTVAATELTHQLPTQRMVEHPDDLRHRRFLHATITSHSFDSIQLDGRAVLSLTVAKQLPVLRSIRR